MDALRFWLPAGAIEQEIIIPGEFVESVLLAGAEHEAGHIVAAHHFEARLFGIGVGFLPDGGAMQMFLQALYGWRDTVVERDCIVKAAGPASDLLFHGCFTEADASGDLRDIAEMTGEATLELYLGFAKAILSERSVQVRRVAAALRDGVQRAQAGRLGILPNGYTGVLLLDEETLAACLRGPDGPAT